MNIERKQSGEPLIIQGDQIWDGIRENAHTDWAVRIEGNRISDIGPVQAILDMPHTSIMKFPGVTLMPGLIDSHTHLSMDPTLENYLYHMSDPVAVLTLRATVMMKKDLEAGITTCRCCGDKEFLDIACRTAVELGDVPGPGLLVATRGIRASNGHGFVGYPFDGEENIRQAIRENAESGSDFTKIYITGTLKGKGSLPSYLHREEIEAAIDESHQAGLRLTAHCVGGEGLDWAIRAGIDSIEHAYHITERQIEGVLKAGTWIVLTPGPILTEERVDHLPPDLIPGHRLEKEDITRCMEGVIGSGIPYAVGTDGMHGDLAREIRYLTEMGATAHAALQAGTINGARLTGIDNRTGSLEPGKFADILAVRGNPVANINALTNVEAVIKQGSLVYSRHNREPRSVSPEFES